MSARLIMIPVPISEGPIEDSLPITTVQAVRALNCFLVENAKTARAFLKAAGHPKPIAELSIAEIGHQPDPKLIAQWLKPLTEGVDIGVLSEAGCPGIADPGAQLALWAQQNGYRVQPMVGPCSMIMALMASGLDGQHFRFSGYIPVKEPQRSEAIRDLEKRSASKEGETQLFIETPYRNNDLLTDLVQCCRPDTKILVAMDVTGQNEWIQTKTATQWKAELPQLQKLPTIFGLLAQSIPFKPNNNHSKAPRRRIGK